ncbi:hypothetical protein D9M71_544920 [compost metagenome]
MPGLAEHFPQVVAALRQGLQQLAELVAAGFAGGVGQVAFANAPGNFHGLAQRLGDLTDDQRADQHAQHQGGEQQAEHQAAAVARLLGALLVLQGD